MPEVSIIMPLFNSAQYMGESIESVLGQTFSDWELLLIDDKSSDETSEIAFKYTTIDERVSFIQLSENSGAAVARNKGIEVSKGRYIAFLDSDDIWLSHKLERQLSYMKKNGFDFCYSAYEKINEKGEVFSSVGVPEKVSYTDLLKVSSIGCLTAIYDTSSLGKVSMPLIRKRQDLGLWLKLLHDIKYAYGVNEVLAQYRVRSDSISSNKLDAAKYTWRLYRNVEKIFFPKAVYYFSCYAVNGLLRTKFPRMSSAIGLLPKAKKY